jgi:maleylacetate reductase
MTETRMNFSSWFGLTRVEFGSGKAQRISEYIDAENLGARLALITSPNNVAHGQAEQVHNALGGRIVATVADATVHTPGEILDRTLTKLEGVDGLIALGGGGAIGLSKALGARLELPITAVPTTFSGSEMTPIYGVTSGEEKLVVRDPAAQARLVVYDPDLSRTLPTQIARSSVINALAHCFDSAMSSAPSPLALASGCAVCELVEKIVGTVGLGGTDEATLIGWLSGVALAAGGVGLEHRICHVLGGVTRAPHAMLHAIVLPQVAAFNESAALENLRLLTDRLARDLPGIERGRPSTVLRALSTRWEMPRRLSQIWSGQLNLEMVVAAVDAASLTGRNPRALSDDDVASIIREIL